MELSDEEFLERLKVIRQADRDAEARAAEAEAEARLSKAESVIAALRKQLLDAGITPAF